MTKRWRRWWPPTVLYDRCPCVHDPGSILWSRELFQLEAENIARKLEKARKTDCRKPPPSPCGRVRVKLPHPSASSAKHPFRVKRTGETHEVSCDPGGGQVNRGADLHFIPPSLQHRAWRASWWMSTSMCLFHSIFSLQGPRGPFMK